MNFATLTRIHNNIEKEFPNYQHALAEYPITDEEKNEQQISTEMVDISATKGYTINGKFVETDDDDCIEWSDFLVALELCGESTPTCKQYHEIADRLMYCLYLLAVDNSDSKKELCHIFRNEELESRCLRVDCKKDYYGKHFITQHGSCVCNY